MDADDNLEQENVKSPPKKAQPVSGIAIDALAGLLDSYSKVIIKSRHIISSVPLQPQQPTYSSSAASVSTPVRSTTVTQASTPSVATFQARLNKAEIVVEHLGSKVTRPTTSGTKKSHSILFESSLKPYKYMYQTIYKRADGLFCWL